MKLDISTMDIDLLLLLIGLAIDRTKRTLLKYPDGASCVKTYLKHLEYLFDKINKLKEQEK